MRSSFFCDHCFILQLPAKCVACLIEGIVTATHRDVAPATRASQPRRSCRCSASRKMRFEGKPGSGTSIALTSLWMRTAQFVSCTLKNGSYFVTTCTYSGRQKSENRTRSARAHTGSSAHAFAQYAEVFELKGTPETCTTQAWHVYRARKPGLQKEESLHECTYGRARQWKLRRRVGSGVHAMASF